MIPPSEIQTFSGHLEADCRQTIGAIRAALMQLFASLDADPGAAPEIARRFGLNRNLAWKVSKVVTTDDPFAAVQHLPGASGWSIFIANLAAAGAKEATLGQLQQAIDQFDSFVTFHAGDRANLGLMLDSMGIGGGSGSSGLDLSRQLAFQGNSGIWGIQAKARLTAGFVAPSKTSSDLVDSALIGGLVGLRRLRSNVKWPLFRFAKFSLSEKGRLRGHEAIDGDVDPAAPHLLRSFCTPNVDVELVVSETVGDEYILPAGPVGNSVRTTCMFGSITRGEHRYQREDDAHATYGSRITIPVEWLVFDLYIHQGVGIEGAPEVIVAGFPDGNSNLRTSTEDGRGLPLTERCQLLSGTPPAVGTPLIPRYPELANLSAERLGYPLREFRVYRLEMRHPPMPSTVILRSLLPRQPGG